MRKIEEPAYIKSIHLAIKVIFPSFGGVSGGSLTGWFFAYPPFRASLNLSDLHIHVMVLRSLTPIDLLVQSAVLLFNSPIGLAMVNGLCYFSLRKKYKHCHYEKNRETSSH